MYAVEFSEIASAEETRDPREMTARATERLSQFAGEFQKSVVRHPALFVTAAVATGVVLGCLLKK